MNREEALKIDELQQSITALLDNMPLQTFSKSVETGAYLACNQAFAEYAGKQSPADIMGLTDYDLFDKETADQYVADDRKAIAADEAYIFREDVADVYGNPRHFRTTKLKFYDATGRLCLLGMSVDITEIENVRKENEETRAAYQEALSTSAVYENIVHALTEDYFNVFYVDLETDEYIEYGFRTDSGQGRQENRGSDFFGSSRKNALIYIVEADQKRFIEALTKENMLREIRNNGVFNMQYRLLIDQEPRYVNMKAACIKGDDRHMIMGVSNVDAQTKYRMAVQQAEEERKTYLRLSALTGNLVVLYIVDLESDIYTEYSATRDYEDLGIAKQGDDFFGSSYENSAKALHPDDLEMFRSLVTRDNVLASIEKDGVFVLDYRLIAGDLPTYVRFNAAKIEEDGKPILIIGLFDVDAQVRHEQENAHDLSVARNMASRDALTGVKNKHAYVEMEQQLNEQIEEQKEPVFAIVVCDINDLKVINDTKGHTEGDNYIRKACYILCDIFKHSPVFRVGGDEFTMICQGHDYEHLDELMEKMNEMNARNSGAGDVRIACGMARFEGDRSVGAVFERADRHMYEHKQKMKATK